MIINELHLFNTPLRAEISKWTFDFVVTVGIYQESYNKMQMKT